MAGEYDLNRMQEDAVRRAREMQSRARFPREESRAGSGSQTGAGSQAGAVPRPGRPFSGASPSPGHPSGEPRRNSAPAAPPGAAREENKTGQQEAPPGTGTPSAGEGHPGQEALSPQEQQPAQEPAGILETLLKDKERTIILALLILLGSEGNNHELMFALMFLLM